MSEMRAAVLGAKGSLSIETNRGFGTAVTIVIPKHEALIAPRAAE